MIIATADSDLRRECCSSRCPLVKANSWSLIMAFVLGFLCGFGFCLATVATFVVWMVKVDLETENRFLRKEQAGRDQWRRVLDGEEQLT
jgi:hypothetical protein